MRDWSYASPSQLEGMVDRKLYSSRHVAIVISCNTDGYCGAAYDVGTQESLSLKRLLRLNPQVWLNRAHNYHIITMAKIATAFVNRYNLTPQTSLPQFSSYVEELAS